MSDNHIKNLKHPIRCKVYDEDQIHDISDFYINNLKDNLFKSTYKDMNFCLKDMQYLIIYGDIFESIINDVYNKGFKDGKKSKQNIEIDDVS